MRGLVLLVAIAGGSAFVVAPAPSYDPWAWLLWGRELTEGHLSTAEGPAFKPLPVAVCAVLAPFGDAAPWLWVMLVRAAAVAAAWLAFGLARDLAGGSRAAGILAAVGVGLCGALPTYAASGAETPLVLALAFGGAAAWRSGRPGAALACGLGCALLRVEAWPFLLALGIVLWRRGSVDRRLLAALAVAVPAAWLVPEYLGSGDLLRSGARAQVPNPGQPALAEVPALASLQEAAGLALWPLLVGAVVALVRRPRAEMGRWALAGAAWIAIVAAMAQLGFSGEARYAVPGAAAIAVAGAAGLVVLARRTPRPGAALVVAFIAVAAAAVPRLDDLVAIRSSQDHQWRLATRLDDAIAAAGGRRAVLSCAPVYVGRLRAPLMAHALAVEKRDVEPDAAPGRRGIVFRSRLTSSAPPAPPVPAGFALRARAGPWGVFADRSCPGVAPPPQGRTRSLVRGP